MRTVYMSNEVAQYLGPENTERFRASLNNLEPPCYVCDEPLTDGVVNTSVFLEPERAVVRFSHDACAPSELVKDTELHQLATALFTPGVELDPPTILLGLHLTRFNYLRDLGMVSVDTDVIPFLPTVVVQPRPHNGTFFIGARAPEFHGVVFDGPMVISNSLLTSLIECPVLTVLAAPVQSPERPEVFDELLAGNKLAVCNVMLSPPAIERNSPCICSSGKKWKNCHGPGFDTNYARTALAYVTPQYLRNYPATYVTSEQGREFWQLGPVKTLIPAIKETLPPDMRDTLVVYRNAILTGSCEECGGSWGESLQRGIHIDHAPSCRVSNPTFIDTLRTL